MANFTESLRYAPGKLRCWGRFDDWLYDSLGLGRDDGSLGSGLWFHRFSFELGFGRPGYSRRLEWSGHPYPC